MHKILKDALKEFTRERQKTSPLSSNQIALLYAFIEAKHSIIEQDFNSKIFDHEEIDLPDYGYYD